MSLITFRNIAMALQKSKFSIQTSLMRMPKRFSIDSVFSLEISIMRRGSDSEPFGLMSTGYAVVYPQSGYWQLRRLFQRPHCLLLIKKRFVDSTALYSECQRNHKTYEENPFMFGARTGLCAWVLAISCFFLNFHSSEKKYTMIVTGNLVFLVIARGMLL